MDKKNDVLEIGKDEMNLVEFPITLLTKRHESNEKTLEFSDTIVGEDNKLINREWIVTGSDKFGLPLAMDNDVLLALLMIGKETNFASPTIHFSRYKLCKIMGWLTNKGSNYKRIEFIIKRLHGVRIYAKNAFWDNERKCYVTLGFGIIDSFFLYDSYKPAGQPSLPISSVHLNEFLYQSIKNGYIKNLDISIYFKLKSVIAKRLFRYLDKKAYGKKKFEINLFTLAHAHIGLKESNYKYPFEIKRKLNPAHEELVTVGFLKSAEYQQTSDGTSEKVVYTFTTKDELSAEAPCSEEPGKTEIVKKLIERGITQRVAVQISREYSVEVIEAQMEMLPHRKADDPAAVLITAIQGSWAAPSSYQQKKNGAVKKEEEQQRQACEEREKKKRRETIEQYLAVLTPADRALLTDEARELFRHEGGAFFKDKELPEYMVNSYVHMVVEKRLERAKVEKEPGVPVHA